MLTPPLRRGALRLTPPQRQSAGGCSTRDGRRGRHPADAITFDGRTLSIP
jgi:hypothetical protein